MKTPALVFILLCFYFNANAQFALINDKDGFVNIRKDKNVNSITVGKLDSNSIVRVWDEDVNKIDWLHIYLQTGYTTGTEGYVHKSRLKFISDFKSIKNIKYQSNFCSAKNDSINIKVSSSRFFPKNHHIKYHKQTNNEGSYYESIDNKPIWGTDGRLPEMAINAMSVVINGKSLSIPGAAFNDLYEPRFSTMQVYLGPNNNIYIELDNSDGAGYYSVIWTITNYKYAGRHLDRGI
ncbi:MAG: SH3 domain-containing protein [Bacteroidota bacterium]